MVRGLFLKPPVFFYEKFIKRQKEGISFVIFSFFLLTFVVSRLWVYLAVKNIVPDSITENIEGVHIHHFAYGVVIVCLVGYFSLVLPARYFNLWKLKLAGLFGIGLGWTFDEFGMWLRLKDDYWLRQSYDAIIVLSVIFINIIYLANFWKRTVSKIFRRKKRRP